MDSSWMIELERQLRWAIDNHGATALAAAIWGVGFLLGAMIAAGIVATGRRALRAWRVRPLGPTTGTPASLYVELEDFSPELTTIRLPTPPPPPLPGRLLN
jgi:hypothetical protein